MAAFPKRLTGKTIVIFVDFTFEDMEVMYPKMRLEEEGAKIIIAGSHPAGTKYTGKYGYPLKSDITAKDVDFDGVDALILPGGFAPDYMRRDKAMLAAVAAFAENGKPLAAICHGPWMFCSARNNKVPVISGKHCTSFFAIKDDLINAGAIWTDKAVVVDGNFITSRSPNDLIDFCHAIISMLV